MDPGSLSHEMGEESCSCLHCKGNRAFEMPDQLAHACKSGDLVIFAGAGISTENPVVMSSTLYSSAREEVLSNRPNCFPSADPSFPSVMTAYEKQFGRHVLLQRIKKHLDFVDSFPRLSILASEFHRELSSIYTISDIVTTNWDNYFERYTKAQPFVLDDDWA